MVGAVDLLYRALYRGVLSQLPERTAIAMGQWGLRHAALDRLGLFRNARPAPGDDAGRGAARESADPLVDVLRHRDPAPRHGPRLGRGDRQEHHAGARGPGIREPNLVRIETAEGPGLVNCNGFKNPGLEAYRRALAGLPHRVPLIVAAAGESAEDYVRVVEGLQEFGDLVELNISSPNTKLVYGWSTRPARAEGRVPGASGPPPRKPLIVKISPDFRETNEEITIPAALDAGITIVNYGNTRRVDEPRLSQRTGGLSGPPSSDHARQRAPGARALRRSPRDHRHRGHRHARKAARQALDGGRHRVRDLHRLHHAGPMLPRRILDALQAAEK